MRRWGGVKGKTQPYAARSRQKISAASNLSGLDTQTGVFAEPDGSTSSPNPSALSQMDSGAMPQSDRENLQGLWTTRFRPWRVSDFGPEEEESLQWCLPPQGLSDAPETEIRRVPKGFGANCPLRRREGLKGMTLPVPSLLEAEQFALKPRSNPNRPQTLGCGLVKLCLQASIGHRKARKSLQIYAHALNRGLSRAT
jgi:hypothetical protein